MSVSVQAPLTTATPIWANQNALDNSRRQELTQSEIRLETPRAPSAPAETTGSGAMDEQSPTAVPGSQPAAYASPDERLAGSARIAVARAGGAETGDPTRTAGAGAGTLTMAGATAPRETMSPALPSGAPDAANDASANQRRIDASYGYTSSSYANDNQAMDLSQVA